MNQMYRNLTFALIALPLFAQQAQVNLDFNPQKNTQNLLPFGANVLSPEVRDDRTITFRLKAPDAQQVLLANGPLLVALKTKTAIPFTKDATGVWTLTIGPVAPDVYVYKLIIDGATVADPNNTFTGFGAQPGYSQVVVPGDGAAFHDARNVPHGTITRHIYHSDVTSGEREMYVYTPPGYNRSKKYPLLVLLGGSGETASGWMFDGRANFIADNLLAEHRMVPMVIAMPNNQVLHRNDPQHGEQTFPLFEAELRKHILPVIERNYNVRKDAKGRALAGLSMGGRHTLFVGLNNALDLFTSFGVLSAGDLDVEKMSSKFLKDPKANNKVDYLLLAQGKAEEIPGSRGIVTHQVFEKYGIRHEYYAGGAGAHDWVTWRHLLYFKLLPALWR
jgi:enterochelin esterase-like enzyme